MITTETEQTLEREKLAFLKKERARICNEIAKLEGPRLTKNEKKVGYVRYMHSPYDEKHPLFPRITLAAVVDHNRNELYYGLRVWNKGFNRKVSRHKALGKALSTTQRKIARLNSTDNQAIQDKMLDILERANITALTNAIKNNPEIARIEAAKPVRFSNNGTH